MSEFTIFIAKKDNKRIEFVYNENQALWFRIMDERNNSFVDGLMMGYFPDEIATYFGGSVDRFFTNYLLPECNAILKKVFGSGGSEPEPEPIDVMGQIEQRLRALQFDPAKNELK